MTRLGVAAEDLSEAQRSDPVRLLLAYYAERARIYYDRAASSLPEEDRRALRPAEAMGRIYRRLLDDLQRAGFPGLRETLRVSRARRLWIAASVWSGIGSRR